jgi:membrane protein implicated in regulation of membrane protease activity
MEAINSWLKPEVIWFAIGLIFLVIEFAAPGMIIAFFGFGAWVVAIICLVNDISFTTQLIVFLITSVLSLTFFRKYFKRVFNLESIQNQENEDEFIGHKAICTVDIKENKPGKVEFKGAGWAAESDAEINKGDTVKIIDRNSITLIVEPLK